MHIVRSLFLLMAGVVSGVALLASCGDNLRLGASAPIDASAPDASAPIDAPAGPLALELFAGDIRGPGNLDGTGAAAHFYDPAGVASDGAGNLYVADRLNHTIRRVTPAGMVTTLAGTPGVSGSADGTGAAARFSEPIGVTVDSAGNLYVADSSNHTIRKITPAGAVTTLAGTPGMSGSTDGTGAAARFNDPWGVAVDRAGNVYVADLKNHTIRKVTAAGVVTTLAGTAGESGSSDGEGSAARFRLPKSVAVDSADNIYVADTDNDTIRKITAGVVTTLAGTARTPGSADGTGANARFTYPSGVAVDGAGNLYVTDWFYSLIRKVTADGVVTTLAGTADICGSTDGTGPAARFCLPIGVAVDGAGNVYVGDYGNSAIRKITTGGIVTTLAGTAGYGHIDDTGPAARFSDVVGMTVDGTGNIYVVDQGSNTIRKVTAAGVVTTLAGTMGVWGYADGTGAAARFTWPTGVALDSIGNLYVADRSNSTIRKITAAGVVTTLAGSPFVRGSTDGTGAAASFYFPSDVAVDSADNLYVADEYNHTIRKVTPAGVVTTLAGTAGVSGSSDSTGAAAQFNYPSGVAVDSSGNLYVADTGNSLIRKVTPAGYVTTLAGAAGVSGSTDGTGAAARFNHPTGLLADRAGNVYVADTGNAVIRKITAAGGTTTVVGAAGRAGIILGTNPGLAFPRSLAIVGDSIFISDSNAILLLRHGAR